MEDVLRRLGSLEADVSTIKTELGAVVVQLPRLATKADVAQLAAQLPHMATKADIAQTKADISDAKTSIIQWMVGTMTAVAAVAFTIAKFVH